MGGIGVIDRFLEVFTQYIDSGFGLLRGEVTFLSSDCSGRWPPTRMCSPG